MTIRYKITLLITAAGVLSSLVFSCFILLEMLERPLQLKHLDIELEAAAKKAVQRIVDSRPVESLDDRKMFGNEPYWMVIWDQDSGREIYRSALAELIKVPEPAPGLSVMSDLTIPRRQNAFRHNGRDDLTLRIKSFEMGYGGRRFLVTAGRSVEQLEQELWDVVLGVTGGLAVSFLLLLAVSYFVAGFILKPVRLMDEQARDISEKHLDRRMPVGEGRDEFNELARTLNRVFDRLQHAFFRQKRLLADASHELKTPLTMMRLTLDEQRLRLGESETDDENQVRNLERMTEQVLRMERLVKSLLDLSALEIQAVAIRHHLDLTELLRSLIADYRVIADSKNIRINVTLPELLFIEGDAEKLNRAFSNLLDNAIKYNHENGRIDIMADRCRAGWTVGIGNTGPVVPEADIPKIFDQFFRVEKSRSQRHGGSGLGLAIVKRIIELHGGTVIFESRQEGWTQVTVYMP